MTSAKKNSNDKRDDRPSGDERVPRSDEEVVKENRVSVDGAVAHDQADNDIANDPDFSPASKNDDLDEGELARLGEDNNPVE